MRRSVRLWARVTLTNHPSNFPIIQHIPMTIQTPLLLGLQLAFFTIASAGEPIIWKLWPGDAPSEGKDFPAEIDTTTPESNRVADKRVSRIQHVAAPEITIFKPSPAKDTGTAVVIAPGGGHWILAYDLEGTEVAEWFNWIGVTAILLKYRVPGEAHYPKKRWLASVQDGQRAMSLVRSRAKEIGIDPNKIGIMGFSAGGSPTFYTALSQQRLYKAVDAHDTVSFRPNFVAPIYTASFPEGITAIPADSPPFFMVITHDDEDRSIAMAETYIKLKKAGVSAELHIYESGGHGYGLRRTALPVTTWPDRMEAWMRRLDLLTSR